MYSDVSNTILSNIDRTRTSFFEHRTNSNMFIYHQSNIDRTSNEHRTNIEHFCYFDVHNNYYSKSSIWTFCEELEEDSILLLIIEISFSVSQVIFLKRCDISFISVILLYFSSFQPIYSSSCNLMLSIVTSYSNFSTYLLFILICDILSDFSYLGKIFCNSTFFI